MFKNLFAISLMLANYSILTMDVGQTEESKGIKRKAESKESHLQTTQKKTRIIPEGLAIDLESPETFLSEQNQTETEFDEESNEVPPLNEILKDSEKKDLTEKEEKQVNVHQEKKRRTVDQTFFLKKKLEIIEAVCDSKIDDFKRGNLYFNDLIKIIRAEINRFKIDGDPTFYSLILKQNFIDPFMDFLSNKLGIHQFELAVFLDTKQTRQYLESYLVPAEKEICNSVFLLAIQYMRLEICQLLLTKGIELSKKCFSEKLLDAICNKRSNEVAFLLKIGANANSVSLHDAILYGNKEIVQMLLDAGADINQVRDNITPLKFIISNTNLMIKSQNDINSFWEIFYLLLSRGAKK